MRRFAIAFALFTLAASSAEAWNWGPGTQGDGKKVTQQRAIPGAFDAVQTSGSIDARITVGPAPSISVTIDENLQPQVKLELRGSTLVIEQEGNMSYRGDAYVTITLPVLKGAATSGSGDATIDGSSGGDLSLKTSGSGDLRWTGTAKRLEVATSGSGDAVLSGKADSLDAHTSGSGDVKGAELTVAGDVSVSTSGSGDVEIRMTGGALKARTSGSGDVVYLGDARNVDARTSGSGEVRRR
ncbi:MAG: head GIN domain-containing protein [Anaeromyxobacter sp.]